MFASPSDTLTFLLSDIEGSTRICREFPDAWKRIVVRHNDLFTEIVCRHYGRVVRTEGDSVIAVFAVATDAVRVAVEVQQALRSEPWPLNQPLLVRIGVHTGEVEPLGDDYCGLPIHACSRLCSAANGGQIFLSALTAEIASSALPQGTSLRDLGELQIRDFGPQRVFQLMHPGLGPEADRPPRAPGSPSTNVQRPPSQLVGRQRELEWLRSRLSPGSEGPPLVTLRGAGGCGKTRLALEVASDLCRAYPDGAWLVPLADLSDPSIVPQAVASALRLGEEPGRPLLETLVDSLRGRRLLLVLDNCEHVLFSCRALAVKVLHSCPGVRLLATSRQALDVREEQVFDVSPLPLLDLPPADVTPAHLDRSDAARLFVLRARQRKESFAPTARNAPAVAHICARLAGIPLAIELAASLVEVLEPEEIACRLDGSFALLRRNCPGGPSHHQTLETAMDWSIDLLVQAERSLLRRLAVFAGGFTLSDAEAVCSDARQPVLERQVHRGAAARERGLRRHDRRALVSQEEIAPLLFRLVNKSLVTRRDAGDGRSRYHLLEPIRQYCLERLAGSSEVGVLRRRHCEQFLRVAEKAEEYLWGPEQSLWLAQLATDHDNLRAAIGWALEDESGGAERALRLSGALVRFWETAGCLAEGRNWLRLSLERPAAAARTPGRAKALDAAGFLAWVQGDYDRAIEHLEGALAIHRELGDDAGAALALGHRGCVAWSQGDQSEAQEFLQRSLELCQQVGDRRGEARALTNLGIIAQREGSLAQARALFTESLALRRAVGHAGGVANSLSNLGNLARVQGELDEAERCFRESLNTFRAIGDRGGTALLLNYLGELALDRGSLEPAPPLAGEQPETDPGQASPLRGLWKAAAFMREGLEIYRQLGSKRGTALGLLNLAEVASLQARHADARQHCQESLVLWRELADPDGTSRALYTLAGTLRDSGELESAARVYRECLSESLASGSTLRISGALEGVAGLAQARGRVAQAVNLAGAAAAIDEQGLLAASAPHRAWIRRFEPVARAALGNRGYESAWLAGKQWTLEGALAKAREALGSE